MTGSHEIAALSFWRLLWLPVPVQVNPWRLGFFIAPYFITQVVGRAFWPDSGWRQFVVLIFVSLVILLVALLIGRIKTPKPVADLDAGVVHIGSQQIPFAEITDGSLIHIKTKKQDDLYLWFGSHKRRHTTVALREGGVALDGSDRDLLVAILERSSIQLPAAKRDLYDPKGKFAWLDQQGYATKEQVLDAILHTPATGDVRRN